MVCLSCFFLLFDLEFNIAFWFVLSTNDVTKSSTEVITCFSACKMHHLRSLVRNLHNYHTASNAISSQYHSPSIISNSSNRRTSTSNGLKRQHRKRLFLLFYYGSINIISLSTAIFIVQNITTLSRIHPKRNLLTNPSHTFRKIDNERVLDNALKGIYSNLPATVFLRSHLNLSIPHGSHEPDFGGLILNRTSYRLYYDDQDIENELFDHFQYSDEGNGNTSSSASSTTNTNDFEVGEGSGKECRQLNWTTNTYSTCNFFHEVDVKGRSTDNRIRFLT
jgi:hypothetical protein